MLDIIAMELKLNDELRELLFADGKAIIIDTAKNSSERKGMKVNEERQR